LTTDPGIGPVDLGDTSATLHALEAAEEVEPDAVYLQPQALVAASLHKTLELQTVKLSDDIDPRKLATQLSMQRGPAVPPFDSGWPPADVVLTSSQRPSAPSRRWRVPALLLTLLGALLLLVLARAAWRPAGAGNATASAVRPAVGASLAPAIAAKSPAGREPVATAANPAGASVQASSIAPPSLTPERAALPAHHEHGAVKPSSLPAASSPALAASSSAKPKRAIY
jgi:hypothetical protein